MKCLAIDLVTGKETWEMEVRQGKNAKPYLFIFYRYDFFPTPVWKQGVATYCSSGMEQLRDTYIQEHLTFEKL